MKSYRLESRLKILCTVVLQLTAGLTPNAIAKKDNSKLSIYGVIALYLVRI